MKQTKELMKSKIAYKAYIKSLDRLLEARNKQIEMILESKLKAFDDLVQILQNINKSLKDRNENKSKKQKAS